MEELVASFFLAQASFMDFRLLPDRVATASDASEKGGGLCASQALSNQGKRAADKQVGGEAFEEFEPGSILVVSIFDGIGSLRAFALLWMR